MSRSVAECFDARVDDLACRVDRPVQFKKPEPPEMIVLLEGQPERVHLAVALVTCLLAGDMHAFTERPSGFLGQLGIHVDWNVGNIAAKQLVAYPVPAPNGVVVEVGRVRHQPGRVRQDPHALILRKTMGLRTRFPVRGQVIDQGIAMIPVAIDVD